MAAFQGQLMSASTLKNVLHQWREGFRKTLKLKRRMFLGIRVPSSVVQGCIRCCAISRCTPVSNSPALAGKEVHGVQIIRREFFLLVLANTNLRVFSLAYNWRSFVPYCYLFILIVWQAGFVLSSGKGRSVVWGGNVEWTKGRMM